MTRGDGYFSRTTSLRRFVSVVSADPELPILALVAPLRRVVEDRVVRHDELQPAPGRRVGVVDVLAVPDERAEPRALREVPDDVGPRRTGVLLHDRWERVPQRRAGRQADLRHRLARLLLRLREAEVDVEVARR